MKLNKEPKTKAKPKTNPKPKPNPKPKMTMSLHSVDLAGLHDFNVYSFCQPQIGEVDGFDTDVEENLGQADDEDSDHDDSKDNDFREWQVDGSEESDSFSLDEEDDLEPKNESLDDIDLENDTQLRMTSGHGSIDDDVGENVLIVNKKAKIFRQGKLWSRNRGGKGIIKTLKNVMPRICVLYFYKNFTSNYPEFVFKKAIEKIKDEDISDFHRLRDKSFNNTIVKHRGKLTYTILEEIRKLIGARFDKRFQMSIDWEGKLTPFVEKKLKQLELESRNCSNLVLVRRGEFSVREGSTNFTVKLAAITVTVKGGKSVAYLISMWLGAFLAYTTSWITIATLGFMLRGESELPALDPPFELTKNRRQEKYKRWEIRLPMPPKLSTIQLSGTKRCKKCKQLGHNSLTCGQPRDENGRIKYKKKPQKKTGNPVGRPRKIQRVSQASTSIAAASGVPTQSSQTI
ncbi:hypothetical protein Cgig2_030023 [Carnegiea gigantea]|uniref:Uncharacterized protein n=1 Tax=Carnegiea gigantea TaxID=171969 RepID=A0A9Q1JLF4_9CARY|nr:hypothetical protein Cgig2_030023 [Carnegiea gigantea]